MHRTFIPETDRTASAILPITSAVVFWLQLPRCVQVGAV